MVAALRGREPFSPETLSEIDRLTRELEKVAGVRRVDSLATVPIVRGQPDGSLSLSPAMGSGPPKSVDDAASVALRLEGDRIVPRNLVSADGRVFAVTVLMDDLGAENDERVVDAVRHAIGDGAAWVSGGPVFRTETNRLIRTEIALFVPITILVIAVLFAAVFRTTRAALIPLATSGVGTWVLLGVMGGLGVPLTISTMILPSVLLALGCAYVTHVIAAASAGEGREGDLLVRIAPVLRPIALSGLTTSLGFVAISLVRIDVIRYVGGFGALGSVTVMLAALTLAPACLRIWPLPAGQPRIATWLRGPGLKFVRGLIRTRPQAAVACWLVVAVVFAVGIARLEVETDVILYFPKGTDVRDDYIAITRALSGISPMNVVVTAGPGLSVTEPEVVEAIAGLAAHLEAMPEVGRSISVADPLIQLHRGFTGNTIEGLPETRDAVEQYLLLLESVDHISDVISDDYTAANVILRVDNNGSNDLLMVAREAERWWGEHGPREFGARTTGIMHEYARSEHEIESGQIRGLVFAFLAIGVILLAVFRSYRTAAVAMVPNAVPVIFAFGLMGLFGVPLDAGTVLLGTLALGIAIDDTIHVVAGYHQAIQRGETPNEAIESGVRQALPAITYTTAAIAAGFAVLGLSDFTLTRNLGLVTSGVMVICYLADVLLLPPLLALSWRLQRRSP